MKLRLFTVGLALAALMSMVINVWQHKLISDLRLKPVSVQSDEPYIQKAATYWGRKTGTTTSRAMNDRYGKVIFFAGQACVSLELEAGGVGGVPVYCFDERSGQLTGRYDNVE
nr:MAG: hypothetical protein DIU57_18905 [Pseudomonadota bacterium]